MRSGQVVQNVLCVRCQKPVGWGRRKYCSEACADSAMRERKKVRIARIVGVAKYRRYPKETV